MKPSLSVVMITHNEAENLPRTLQSVAFADEIIIVDDGSIDDTVKVAKEMGAKVIHQEWLGFGKQKNVAIDAAQSDWILSLDADEVVSDKTRGQILQAMDSGVGDAFYLPRQAWFLGRWIMHGGWYPDWQLRLFKRGVTRFNHEEIHERMKETKKTGYLPEAVLDHYSYKDIADYITRLNRYTTEEAKLKKHQRLNTLMLFVKPVYRFGQQYVWHRGFLDGFAGLIIALLSAWYVFIVHLKVAEMRMHAQSRH